MEALRATSSQNQARCIRFHLYLSKQSHRPCERHLWKVSFPKGHVKDNETSIQCALRELREETSIQLSQDILYSHYKELASGGYFIYTMEEEASMIPEDTCEIQECGWFTLEQMKEMDCNVDVNRYLTYRARELKCESPTWRGTLPSPLRQNTTQGTYQDAMLSP